jgi:hypothetical protein
VNADEQAVKARLFYRDYEALIRKYGVAVMSCGCCPPFLMRVDEYDYAEEEIAEALERIKPDDT